MKNGILASDLYHYLISFGDLLAELGETARAAQVLHLNKFASGSTSEFYGEARLLLPNILNDSGGTLSEIDREKLRQIIARIDQEFARIGGA